MLESPQQWLKVFLCFTLKAFLASFQPVKHFTAHENFAMIYIVKLHSFTEGKLIKRWEITNTKRPKASSSIATYFKSLLIYNNSDCTATTIFLINFLIGLKFLKCGEKKKKKSRITSLINHTNTPWCNSHAGSYQIHNLKKAWKSSPVAAHILEENQWFPDWKTHLGESRKL